MGTLIYNSEWNRLELDGDPLQSGQRVEIFVFGYWIPGQIAVDTAGWHLLTPDLAELPLHSGLSARPCPPGIAPLPPFPSVEMHAPHILIVDDDPALLQALPQTVSLRIPQARVDTSNSAQGALEQIQKYHYDTIVSDIKMPGMDGLELLARIHELRPGTPMLLITGHGEHDLAIQALRGGAYDYILKPIDRDYFVAALRRAPQTQQLQHQVAEQQYALELHSRLLEGLMQQQTHELFEAHEAKEKMINVVSHVLKPPLAHQKEMTQLLRLKLGFKLEGTNVREMVSQGLADIEHSIEQTEMLVQELLHLSRLEPTMLSLHRHPCDLVALCRQVLEEFAASTGCALTCGSLHAPIVVEVDEKQMGRSIISLLSMAYKNAPQRSPITVKLKQTGQKAILTLRYRSAAPALGMQFYVSRKIIEQHAGRLEVQSSPDNETTYIIMLPQRIDPAEEQTDTARHTQGTQALWTITT
ncbi:MAG TPA: response regulator [Ktedonobacteraceae bacterium]